MVTAAAEVSTFQFILALVGLVIGLVVLIVVIQLLNKVYAPIREIGSDVDAANSAPLIERGVVGADQLGRTRQLATQVPDLAMAYLAKLGAAPKAGPTASYSRPGPAPNPFAGGAAPGGGGGGGGSRSGWMIEDS